MSIPIEYHIINLERKPENFERITKALRQIGVEPSRIRRCLAVDGNKFRPYIEKKYTRAKFVPSSVLGCAASHINLACKLKQIHQDHPDKYYVILEDDAHPKVKHEQQLYDLIHEAYKHEKEWDMLRLFCIGTCNPKPRKCAWDTTNQFGYLGKTSFSCMAYCLSPNGMDKVSKLKPLYHVDFLESYTWGFRVIFARNMFMEDPVTGLDSTNSKAKFGAKNTLDKEGVNSNFISRVLDYKAARIPLGDGMDVTTAQLIAFCVILGVLLIVIAMIPMAGERYIRDEKYRENAMKYMLDVDGTQKGHDGLK